MSTSILGVKSEINRQLGVDAARKTVVTATFHPRKGWNKMASGKKLSALSLIAMKMQGVAYITAAADSRRADFSMAELFA